MSIFLAPLFISESAGVIAAAAFFLVFAAIAYIAFRLLKKTVKMAFRIVIVGIILLIATAGSLSFWWIGAKSTRSERPRTTQRK